MTTLCIYLDLFSLFTIFNDLSAPESVKLEANKGDMSYFYKQEEVILSNTVLLTGVHLYWRCFKFLVKLARPLESFTAELHVLILNGSKI